MLIDCLSVVMFILDTYSLSGRPLVIIFSQENLGTLQKTNSTLFCDLDYSRGVTGKPLAVFFHSVFIQNSRVLINVQSTLLHFKVQQVFLALPLII